MERIKGDDTIIVGRLGGQAGVVWTWIEEGL